MQTPPRLLPLSASIALCLLAACSPTPSGASANTAPDSDAAQVTEQAATEGAAAASARTGTSLKIWSGDFESVQAGNAASGNADVAQVIERELPAGRGDVSVVRLPAALDLGGVQLLPRDGAQVLGQRFDLATATPAGVLERARGQRVTVRTTSGDKLTGTLVGAGADGLTLDVDGELHVVGNYSDLAIAKPMKGLATEPTLHFTVDAPKAGMHRFDLRYPSGGLAWRAEYAVTLAAGDDCRLALDASALVANRSGASFDEARVTLVAGDPRRAGSMVEAQAVAAPRAMAFDLARSNKVATAGMAGEYHSYELPDRIDLADRSVERIALLAPVAAAACARRYTTRAGTGWWSPPGPLAERQLGGDGEQPVVTTLAFDNDKKAGLGVALPAGRVRVSEADGNLVGEVQIGHTPAGQPLELELGTAFDLHAERKQVDFTLDRDARVITEKFELTVSNGGKRAATVRAVEVLPRWSQWEIVESSVPWEKQDAQTIHFDVPVPAEGRTVLSYTVRYRWPATVKPQ